MASRREHSQHKRHARFARVRHSKQEKAWLAREATRLSSTSTAIFGKLKKYSAREIEAAASLSDIP